MCTTIYMLVYEGNYEIPKTFIQQKPAMAQFSREAKRVKAGDVAWDYCELMQVSFKGSPRAIVSSGIAFGIRAVLGIDDCDNEFVDRNEEAITPTATVLARADIKGLLV